VSLIFYSKRSLSHNATKKKVGSAMKQTAAEKVAGLPGSLPEDQEEGDPAPPRVILVVNVRPAPPSVERTFLNLSGSDIGWDGDL